MNEYREMRREVDRGCLKIFLLGFLGVAMMLAVGIVVWLGIIVWLFSGLEDIDLSYLVEQTDESEARKSSKIGDAAKPLNITSGILPDGEMQVFYDHMLGATGGITPYHWRIQSGNLPNGLSLNSSTGVISGEPVTEGTFNFKVWAQDSSRDVRVTSRSLSISILPDGGGGGEE